MHPKRKLQYNVEMYILQIIYKSKIKNILTIQNFNVNKEKNYYQEVL